MNDDCSTTRLEHLEKELSSLKKVLDTRLRPFQDDTQRQLVEMRQNHTVMMLKDSEQDNRLSALEGKNKTEEIMREAQQKLLKPVYWALTILGGIFLADIAARLIQFFPR